MVLPVSVITCLISEWDKHYSLVWSRELQFLLISGLPGGSGPHAVKWSYRMIHLV